MSEGICRKTTERRERTVFSFAGCGFMGMYHVGIGMCLQEHAEEYLSKITKMYGASAGSIVTVSAACGVRSIEGYKFLRELHDHIYQYKPLGKFGAFHPKFDLMGHVRKFLDRVLPRDAHRKCRNRVGVSLTVLPSMTNWIVSDFNTRAELIQAVVCSCFIPLFAGIQIPKLRGKLCCDGAMSNNLPYSLDPDVITVSPFSGECDICPNGETETHLLTYMYGQVIQASWKNLYRGIGAVLFYSWKEMDEVCAQGFHDAYVFIQREGITLHHPVTTIAEVTPDITLTVEGDEDTSDYSSRSHSRQSSGVSCLDEILEELEDRRDSLLFVEEEVSERGDEDSGIFFKPSQKFQLKWKLKPKALLRKSGSAVMSSVTNGWNSFLETVSEYQQSEDKVRQLLGQSGHDVASCNSTPFLSLPVTS